MKTQIDWKSTALVLVDPQVDVLSKDGVAWDLLGEQVTKRNVVEKMVSLRKAATAADVPVFFSSLQIRDDDYREWNAKNGLQQLMAGRRMMLPGQGARFVPELEPWTSDIMLMPRKGPSAVHSDLFLQLQRRGIQTIVLAGMIANLCVESHVRDATDMGYGAIVVGDAIATISDAAHDGTLANFGLLATEVVQTDEVVDALTAVTA